MMALLRSVDPDRRLGLRDRALVALVMTTGLRASEVAALSIDDINWRRASLTVRRRKNGQPLLLPLLAHVVDALTAYLRARPADCPYRALFLSRYHRPFSSGAPISHLLRRLIAAAGVGTRCAAHALRRGLGTHLLEQGAKPAEIALILGHESLLSTRQYLRLSMEQLREVADNYAELL
jgi:site-specific recombinase XerD